MGNDNAIGANRSDPKVSIVVPAYNVERYFEECLSSIEGQSYRNLEIIVVDDGSTDKTLEIARTHAESDSRIKVITQQNQYAGVARNNGMSVASGDYICFLDADDVFRPFMIEEMLCRSVETNSDVVICRSAHLDDRTKEIRPISYSLEFVDLGKVYSGYDLNDVMFRFCVGWPWDKLYRTDYVKGTGLSFQPLKTTNDAYFVFMSLVLAGRISFLDRECVLHRTNNKDSLEYSRGKTCYNALIAAKEIGDALKARGLYAHYEQSYVNWVVNFSAWNTNTLPEDSRREFVSLARKFAAEVVPDSVDSSYFFLARDAAVASLLTSDDADVLSRAILQEIENGNLEYQNRMLQEDNRSLANVVEEKDSEICRLHEELAREKEEKRKIVESRTYKAGRILMKIPCALKDFAVSCGKR